jgi:spore cortex formation protein SpoVR/YcgB (stage V sporulation)
LFLQKGFNKDPLFASAQVLQICLGYDQNKHAIRRQLVLRTGARWIPNIYVVDDGRNTDGVLTLKHEFDPTYGPLKPSECRDTLKYFRRLYGRPVRLLTQEVREDRQGNPIGGPVPYV